MTNPLRRLPAVVLLVVLGLLPLQAWLGLGSEQLVLHNDIDGLRSITWTGRVAADGRLAVRIAYDLGDDEVRELSVRVPDGAEYLAVDGVPTPASTGVYATVSVSRLAVVTYELPGRVTRYADGALLRMAAGQEGFGSLDHDESLFPCPRCYLDALDYGHAAFSGALHAPGAEDAVLRFTHIRSIRAERDVDVTRFVAIDEGADSVALLATLPGTAVPDVALSEGSVDDALDAAEKELEPFGASFSGPRSDAAGAPRLRRRAHRDVRGTGGVDPGPPRISAPRTGTRSDGRRGRRTTGTVQPSRRSRTRAGRIGGRRRRPR